MGKKDPNVFETKDLHLNAYLTLKKFPHLSYRPSGHTVYVTYELTPELALTVTEYYGNKALADPVQFSNAIKNLRREFSDLIERNLKGGGQNE